MKKLIVCASAAVAACAVNAASFVWGFTAGDYADINGGRDTTAMVYTGGMAYLYLGTVTASSTAFDLSGATLIASGGFVESTYGYGNINADALSTSDLVTSTAAGQKFTLILVDNTSKDLSSYEGNYVLREGTSDQKSIIGVTTTSYAVFTNGSSVAAGDWSSMTASVPEPTSGLLLLIGVAGLALKRKRA